MTPPPNSLLFLFVATALGLPLAAAQEEVPEALMVRFPTLVIEGKRVAVSREAYIAHHLKTAKGKYVLLPIPDG